MKTRILTIFTRTPLHVGAGSSVGAIDQPVQRERHTGFPIIPGSSIKGVLRAHFSEVPTDTTNLLFGKGDKNGDFRAGAVSFGEGRLVAFPVRSAKGAFAFAVSPLTLARLARDAEWNIDIPEVPADQSCLAGSKVVIKDRGAVVLEEYVFKKHGDFPGGWEEKLTNLLDDAVLSSSAGRFVLLSDGDLSHFAINACQVQQHVKIDPELGTAADGALFNEETVPSETLFYSTFTILREKDALVNPVFEALASECLVQFGGDGTTGLGFCTVRLAKPVQIS